MNENDNGHMKAAAAAVSLHAGCLPGRSVCALKQEEEGEEETEEEEDDDDEE